MKYFIGFLRQQQEVDLPPDFKPYSLKNRSFTPTFDTRSVLLRKALSTI